MHLVFPFGSDAYSGGRSHQHMLHNSLTSRGHHVKLLVMCRLHNVAEHKYKCTAPLEREVNICDKIVQCLSFIMQLDLMFLCYYIKIGTNNDINFKRLYQKYFILKRGMLLLNKWLISNKV